MSPIIMNTHNDTLRGHKLLTAKIRAKLPPLYATDELGAKAIVQVKFFTPASNWSWYATEFDGKDTFFGFVVGFEAELGYFLLSDLESARSKPGFPIERDLYFKPTPLGDIMKQHGKTL